MAKKRVLVLGGDGYIGWPVAMKLSKAGYDVYICDNFNKRRWELEIGVKPLLQIPILQDRVKIWEKVTGSPINLIVGDLTNQRFVYDLFEIKPDVIVHGADQPSAPFSMKGINTASATQSNNIVAGLNILFAIKRSCPDSLYVRIGSSSLACADQDFSRELFPCDSFYELSRLHDYNNIYFCCKNWRLKAVIVNTGVVYDVNTEETFLHDNLKTTFHYDRVFGTVVNRFCVEALVGIPLTIYGDGRNKCGFTSLQDTVNSICAAAEHKGQIVAGDFENINAFRNIITINDAAVSVRKAAEELGFEISIEYIENPRKEFVSARDMVLSRLPGNYGSGLEMDILKELIKKIIENKNNILRDSIMPVIKWLND